VADIKPFPKDDLVRAVFPADLELRATADSEMPTLTGHFAVFNEFTEIKSIFEGHFMERIAPGAFAKTFREQTPKVLFNHGSDPQIGNKVLGSVTSVVEDGRGAAYDVEMHDTSYNRDLLPGLRAGEYGASFRFKVVREDIERQPGKSDWNPDGLPERTITEASVAEFGPVTFPAYSSATAGVRSLTDQYRIAQFVGSLDRDKIERMDTEDLAKLAEMIQIGADYIDEQDAPANQANVSVMEQVLETLAGLVPAAVAEPATVEASTATGSDEHAREADGPEDEEETTTAAAPPHPAILERRDTQPHERRANNDDTKTEDTMDTTSIGEMRARQDEIKAQLEEIANENRGAVLSAQDQAAWDQFEAEWDDLDKRCLAEENRQLRLEKMVAGGGTREAGSQTADVYVTRRAGKDKTPENVFDVTAYHGLARDQSQMLRMLGDGAKRALETFDYPHPQADKDKINSHVERILGQDSPDREIAQRILTTGSEIYHRAFWKHITSQPMTNEEQRALAVGAAATGQAAVPVDLDPTIIPTSNGALNPLRQISRVFTTTSYQWSGVTSGGITANYRAEAAIMTDNSPTLAAPSIIPERVDAFVPFSYEIGQDWGSLESTLAAEIQDAKDTVESLKFSVGTGHASNEPRGVLYGDVASGPVTYQSSAATAFSVVDLYNLESDLPARHIPNASWVATPGMFAKVRQLDTAGGANLWVQLADGNPPQLLGYPAYKASSVGTAGPGLATTVKWGVFGDFNKFAIVDRIGMSIRIIPDLFNGNTTGGITYPRGQSGLVAFWRNSAGVIDRNAFRVGTIQ